MDRRGFLSTLLLSTLALAPHLFWAQATQAQGTQAPGTQAQATPASVPARIRGTIASVAGNLLTVTTRDGSKQEIVLTEPLLVMTVKKAELSAIGPNTYVGTTTRTAADGTMTAIEVHIFPEAMRGTRDGHRDWDLEPGSKMTNGTVTGAVTGASGRELTVGHKDGAATKLIVPPTAGIMSYVTGERADLKPGETVFLNASKAADGKLTANRVNVGKDGVAPMM